MEPASPASPRDAEMFCWLHLVNWIAYSLRITKGKIWNRPPAPPRDAQMLRWLASGELDCVFLGKYEGYANAHPRNR